MEDFLFVVAAIGVALFAFVAVRQLVRGLKLARAGRERGLLAVGIGLWVVFMLTHAAGLLLRAEISTYIIHWWVTSNMIAAFFTSTRKELIVTVLVAVPLCAIGAFLVWPLLSGPPAVFKAVIAVFTTNAALLGTVYGLVLFFMHSQLRRLTPTKKVNTY